MKSPSPTAQDNTLPEGIVCPCEAHTPLVVKGSTASCPTCEQTFSRVNGVWDLLLGERFDDEKCECMWCNEESTGRHLAENYIGPLLKKRFSGSDRSKVKILSIGCGVGSDVEALNEMGFNAYGIDAGNRSEFWNRRKWSDHYFLANAKHLPFDRASINVVLMGCVLPHIGVGDDTYETVPGYADERKLAAAEMLRITNEGGYMVLSSPNRLCPVDFFHRADVRSHMPRLHSPKENFLLSVKDYAELLRVGDLCKSIDILPLRNYWGFYSSSTYLLGRILQIPVRWYFNQLLSWQITKPLRSTGLNPWLILLVQR